LGAGPKEWGGGNVLCNRGGKGDKARSQPVGSVLRGQKKRIETKMCNQAGEKKKFKFLWREMVKLDWWGAKNKGNKKAVTQETQVKHKTGGRGGKDR